MCCPTTVHLLHWVQGLKETSILNCDLPTLHQVKQQKIKEKKQHLELDVETYRLWQQVYRMTFTRSMTQAKERWLTTLTSSRHCSASRVRNPSWERKYTFFWWRKNKNSEHLCWLCYRKLSAENCGTQPIYMHWLYTSDGTVILVSTYAPNPILLTRHERWVLGSAIKEDTDSSESLTVANIWWPQRQSGCWTQLIT